jgi:uncharacterized protein YndB with AHSA1/START domain
MPDIVHEFPIAAAQDEVFRALATPTGLNAWWTLDAEGVPEIGSRYRLGFGPEYEWSGVVTECDPGRALEWEIHDATPDWEGTRVGFRLREEGDETLVRFHHTGWPEANSHHAGSSYCWAMYLRIMKRWIELGEEVPYAERLNV